MRLQYSASLDWQWLPRVQNETRKDAGRTVAAVRDPDGNTIELYGR